MIRSHKIFTMENVKHTGKQDNTMDLHISNLAKDSQILEDARQLALAVLESDPLLEHPANSLLRTQLAVLKKTGKAVTDYSQIS